MKRASSIMMSILLLASMLAVSFTTRNVEATGTVYIRADGSIDPPTVTIRNEGSEELVDWWPMFRHDLNRKGYSTSEAPNTSSIVWSHESCWVDSSPAVVDGKVYIGSNDRNVYCLNASTGAYIWNYTTAAVMLAWGSPAVVDGKVYIGSEDDRNVYCLDASTGAYIWSYNTSAEVDGSPAVVDGNVYIGSWDGNVYCLDASTGAYIWNYHTGAEVFSSPAVVDGKVYLGSDDFNVYCLDASTGAYIWNYTTGAYVYSSPAVADGKVYVGSCNGKVYAFGSSSHNVAVKNITPSRTVVYPGYSLPIEVSVGNIGSYTETIIDVTVYVNNTAIQTLTILSLDPSQQTTLTFTWNTTGFAYGHTISAYAWPVPGETDTADNNRTDGSILVTKVGDLGGGVPPAFFNCDGSVDGKDLALFLQCYRGTAPAEAMYLGDLGGGVPPQFYNCDGKVDGKDLSLFLLCYKGLGP